LNIRINTTILDFESASLSLLSWIICSKIVSKVANVVRFLSITEIKGIKLSFGNSHTNSCGQKIGL